MQLFLWTEHKMFKKGKNITYKRVHVDLWVWNLWKQRPSGGSFLLVEQLEAYVNGSQPRDQVPEGYLRIWELHHCVGIMGVSSSGLRVALENTYNTVVGVTAEIWGARVITERC